MTEVFVEQPLASPGSAKNSKNPMRPSGVEQLVTFNITAHSFVLHISHNIPVLIKGPARKIERQDVWCIAEKCIVQDSAV